MSIWDTSSIKEFRHMEKCFEEHAKYHEDQSSRWKLIFNICTTASIVVSFSVICMDITLGDNPIIKYYSLFEKVFTICMLSYIFTVNPGHKASKHDKSHFDYLALSITLFVEAKRVNKVPADVLTKDIATRYETIIDRTKPGKKLNSPFNTNILYNMHIESIT